MSAIKDKKITVIIPTLNEEEQIAHLVKFILQSGKENLAELIVVDGDSTDRTAEIAAQSGARVIKSKQACRATQMNLGAKNATGDILYFVHADVLPPAGFAKDIRHAVAQGNEFGCYRFRFRSRHPLLKINAFFTRFRFLWCRGGDQTLFIDKNVFNLSGGFDERYVVMEDFDLIRRLWKKYAFIVLPKSVEVSARKYKKNSYLRVNIANLFVYRMFKNGANPYDIKERYFKLIKHPKNY